MNKKIGLGKFWLVLFLGMFIAFPLTDAFADWGRPKPRPSAHQIVVAGRHRYRYHEGRFYRPGFFGFWFTLARPPIGIVVARLPFGHRRVVFAGATYYCYDNVYYREHPSGYVVVPAPDRQQKITINIPNSRGSYTPVVLVRHGDGYLGPQGEYYSGQPSVEQLRALYGN